MKLWLGAVIGLCALVALWALPPSRITNRTRVRSPEEVRYDQVAGELRRAHGLLLAQRWSDSLSALVVETAVDGLALAYPPSDLVTAEGVAEWRQAVTARLASFGRRDPDMTVGIVFQLDMHGALEAALDGADAALGPPFSARHQTYVGARDGSPYCFVVLPERYAVRNGGLRSATSLEGCRWFYEYGVPGNAVGAWLEAGAFSLGWDDDVQGVLPTPPLDMTWFGIVRPYSEEIVVAACLAGDAAACEGAVTDHELLAARLLDGGLVELSPISHLHRGRSTPFHDRAGLLFVELEARYGQDAFARFWTSDEPVPVAFEAAFGSNIGVWMRDFSQEGIGSFRAGPLPRAASLGWSMLAVLLLSGFVSWKQMRRRVS
jgi:hypothetical protein